MTSNIGLPSPEYSNSLPDQRPTAEAIKHVPGFVTYTSPVSYDNTSFDADQGAGSQLPLNLIALIIAQIQDTSDLARLCHTSRLLYYMTLPQLYQRVHLRSYANIRYVHGRPQGFGGGSPFIMALHGFVTNANTAAIVQDFRIFGQWREVGIEDFVQGRVPDNSMMLNILLRAATERMTRLRRFSWELDCKPLKPLYQGLASRTTLTHLTIKFPSSRIPRPTVMVPPLPSLRAFRALEIDPLCYPDDISSLLLASKNLRDLRLHFSPRMRQEAEPTLSLQTYFHRCWRAGYRIPLRHFALQNFFGQKTEGLDEIFASETLESVALFDCFGGIASEARNVFVDSTWRDLSGETRGQLRVCRVNEVDEQQARLIGKSRGLEGFFVVSGREAGSRSRRSSSEGGATTMGEGGSGSGRSPESSAVGGGGAGSSGSGAEARKCSAAGTSQSTASSPTFQQRDIHLPPPPVEEDATMAHLGQHYLQALTRSHGSTLRHLLLSPHWPLTPEQISDIVRYCPSLSQLGLAINSSSPHYLRLLMPFLPNLRALRVLGNRWTEELLRNWGLEERLESMRKDLARREARALEVLAIGAVVHVIGGWEEVGGDGGDGGWRRRVWVGGEEDARVFEVWGLDRADLGVDEELT